jgi:stringent starvation protein B
MSNVSTKPYLLRAIYEWCIDQGLTPYIAVSVDERTTVPKPYVKDGQIVLNIGPDAAHQLSMGNELLSFAARFSGVAYDLSIPVDCVAAIYARENGHGMAFEVAAAQRTEAPTSVRLEEAKGGDAAAQPSQDRPALPRPHLVRVK